MKICVVGRGDLQLFPPMEGGSNKIFYTLKYLSLSGAKVFYVTSEHPYYFEIKNGKFKRKNYPKYLRKPIDMEKIKKRIRKIFGIPMEEAILYHPFLNFHLLRKVLYVNRKENPDVFQAEFIGFSFPLVAIKLLYRKPIVLVEHNIEAVRMKSIFPKFKRGTTIAKFLEIFLSELSDVVITSTLEDKKRLSNFGIDESKIIIIPHGVEISKFRKGKRKKIRKKLSLKYKTLIFHGTLSYKPNLWAVNFILSKVIPYLRKRKINFQVLIVGNYPPKKVNEKNVIFSGGVKNLEDYIAAGDIALVPLKAGGGMRIKILEYFASRKPVITTKKGIEGIPAKNGEAIISSLKNFPYAVYKAIKTDGLGKMVEDAFEFVKQYDWKIVGKKYIKIHNTLLEMKK